MSALVVNLYGGPGTGKSTMASHVFAELKYAGIDAELVQEYAKLLTWEHNKCALSNQALVSATQMHWLDIAARGTQVVVTDSPILLGLVYGTSCIDFDLALLAKYREYDNLNFFLSRVKPYNPNGRSQTHKEAQDLDVQIEAVLVRNNLSYCTVAGDRHGAEAVIKYILERHSGANEQEAENVA